MGNLRRTLIVLIVGIISGLLAPAMHARAAFSGTNGMLAFQSDRTGSTEVFTMGADGSSQERLTFENDKSYDAAWAPDGTGLAFSNCCDPGTSLLEIYAMNANGSGATRLTVNTSKDSLPVWSPDGQKIAFVSTRTGNKEIYVMNADGTGQTNLTDNAGADDAPAWSPDGSEIAFARTKDGNTDVYVMNSDGTGVTRLTWNKNTDTEPNWAPGGKRIAFQTNRTGDNEIYVMNADGNSKVNVTNDPSADSRPAWSPDGKKIAFDSNRSGNYDIWVMNSDGTGATNLTNDPAKDQRPDWQPLTDPMFQGIDVSHWQETIDFEAVAGAGIRFVFAKATEGQFFDDPNYDTNRTGAGAAGLAFGAYHYARPDPLANDAVLEADHFIDVASPVSGDLLPVIDLERSGGLTVTALTDWLWAFLDEVEARTGVHALIYTSPSFWETNLGDTDAFANAGYDLLWIAHWDVPTPSVPANDWGGHGWTFWQNSDCFNVPGITGCVDSDFYNGIILTPAEMP